MRAKEELRLPCRQLDRKQGTAVSFQRDLQVIDWQVIIEEHGRAVWQISYRLLGNHADAADCFQETFVSALRFCRRQRVRNFSALLARLATARAIDQLRQRFRRSNFATDITHPECSERMQSSDPCPSQQAQQQELTVRLRESLSRLPKQEATAFCLRYLNDMSYREIGAELGISANATGVLLHRARAKLRESFHLLEKEQK
ncbi:MAG: sigma-70 family RNA polymerase sigma factor [Planctomycetota bacterium]